MLDAVFAGLSPHSRYLRFHGAGCACCSPPCSRSSPSRPRGHEVTLTAELRPAAPLAA